MTQSFMMIGLALILGAAAGAAYFAGLWWTVRRLPRARRPGLLMLASLLARLAGLAGAVYLIGQDDWRRLLAALAGVMLARLILQRRLGPDGKGEATWA